MSVQRWVAPITYMGAQGYGPTLTAAATSTCLSGDSYLLLPANYFDYSKILRIHAAGIISCAITTPGTARYDVRIGGVIAFDSLAMPLNVVAKSDVPWWLEIELRCTSIGRTTDTTILGFGKFTSEAVLGSPLPTVGGSGTFLLPYNNQPVISSGWDNSVANALDMQFTQTVNTGSMTMKHFVIEALN